MEQLKAQLLENLGIWVPVVTATLVPHPTARVLATNIPVTALYLATVASIVVEGMVLAQHLIHSGAYGHLPRYAAGGGAPRTDARHIVADFCRTMLPAIVVSSVGFTIFLQHTKSEADWAAKQALGHQTLRPVQFAAQWAFVRLVVDVTFYALHWAMHRDPRVYSSVHRRHHEHKSPHLWTNWHFSVLDLMLEGFAPYGAALLLMDVIGWRTSALEEFGLLAHVMWFEIGSHAGKPVPTLSFCPWLAPIYRSRWFQGLSGWGDLDAQNVLFHHSHHVLYRCNYGITPWLDHVLGTARLCEATTAYEKAVQS